MIQRETCCDVTDNSGATIAKCFGILRGSRHKSAQIGDIITVAIQKATPTGKVKKGSVQKAVIVRQKYNYQRKDGTFIKFQSNAVVLIDLETKEPIGTRVFGPVARELKAKGFKKIVSLAQEVL
ncbi:MAG: 50S ribosomal protein L14 [Alphaproteobacteria bacterium]|nr:50S ribosomal protein L14 [Alphaproteobacteria bacterium]MBL0718175.1 50S ribosomal protein L14 [Alphaproteobacteria bacterium]